MLTAPFMTRRLTKEFIEKNGRSPTKDEFVAIQHEAVNTLIKNNSVYGIYRQGETKMSEIVFKGKPTPTEGQVIDHTLDPKVAFTSYREQEHEDDDYIYQLSFKAQKELLKDLDLKVKSKYPKIIVCDLLDHIDGNPPPLEIELSGKKPNFLPGGIRDRNSLKIMTKEMYEKFVKQGKKFVTLIGQFNSLEEAGIDIDGDIVIVDGQKYAVNMFSWRK